MAKKKSVVPDSNESGRGLSAPTTPPSRRDTEVAPTFKPSALVDTRVIYCGDNLEQLKKLPDACVDLEYLDPPFNSNRNYEVFWGETKEKRSFEDRHENTRAYIDYMRPRCEQLARVLKKTGSFYYHCDWHASHYVKVMLDEIFGENFFQCEIVWKRHNARSTDQSWPRIHDSIFFYTASEDFTFHSLQVPADKAKLPHTLITGTDGQKYQTYELTAPGRTQSGESGKPWRNFDPDKMGRHWANAHSTMDEWAAAGLIHFPKEGGFPRRRASEPFDEEARMITVGDVWTDIDRINQTAKERLGYPTQKPLALLERIIKASSNPNDIVLDAFCGCGTALVAAEKNKRQWIGIDISPTACRVMEKRLRDTCALPLNEALWAIGRGFIVRDLPKTEEELRKYPPFEFENWAVVALGGRPNKVQVGDKGIDGRLYLVAVAADRRKTQAGELDLKEKWYPIQVKQKDKAGFPDIRAFEAAMIAENCEKGYFVSFGYSSDALTEISDFFKNTHKSIIALTVREILDDNIAHKLA